MLLEGGFEMTANIVENLSSEIRYGVDLSKIHKYRKKAGLADGFLELTMNTATEETDLKIIATLLKNDMPHFIVGTGTNVYFTENGFKGLIVKLTNQNKYLTFDKNNNSFRASANILFSEVVNKACLLGYDLSEFVGIPGMLGSAIVGNAGTHLTGKTISEIVKEFYVYDFENMEYIRIVPSDHKEFFSERSSYIKEANRVKPRYLVTEVVLEAAYIGAALATERKNEIMSLRRDSDIEGYTHGTAGSFFANGSLPHNLLVENIKVRDLIKKLNLHTLDFNGAGYTSIKCFLKTESTTRDHDVAKLLHRTIVEIQDKYGFTPRNEVLIIDEDGIISAEEFITRYNCC
jgi:UDP-N-acetylmuramate dehydrogenase